jgi:glycosyltransferase involved in cell wall biosynthesis
MKILMLAPQPFFEPRGTPISVYQRLEALSSLGHEIDLVTYHVGADVHIPNVRIFRTPRISFIKEVKIGPSWAKPLLDSLMFQVAVSRLLATPYDIIHTHEEAAFLAIPLAALFRIPHVYDMHSSLPRQLENFKVGNWWPLVNTFRWLERWTLRTCNAVISIDAELEQYVWSINPDVRQVRIENRAIPVTHALVDPALVQKLKENISLDSRHPIVYTGTFERYQGLEMLIRSARIVRRHNPKALFILVGGKPAQIERYKEMAREEGVEECVLFVGIVPPDEAVAYLDLADVLVSPRTGGSSVPLKIYSYLVSGKPTVATRTAAHAQVLNDEVAMLVEPEPEALAEALIHLLQNPQQRQQIGSRARRLANERYSFDEYMTRLEGFYDGVMREADTLGRTTGRLERS